MIDGCALGAGLVLALQRGSQDDVTALLDAAGSTAELRSAAAYCAGYAMLLGHLLSSLHPEFDHRALLEESARHIQTLHRTEQA